MPDKITLILADDHLIVREGLRLLLEQETDFQIVGEAADGLETLRLVEKLNPSVLVADLTMPQLNGLEVTRQINQRRLNTRVLILSMHSNEQYILSSLKAGALGYVLKSLGIGELARAIRTIHSGARYLSPPYSDAAISAYMRNAEQSTDDVSSKLSGRERQVLQMVAEGLSSSEIGARLFISARTVEVHRSHIMGKLSLRNSAEVIRYALKHLPLETEEVEK